MKPAPLSYAAPATLDDALALLAEHGDEAKVLAGGQSLMPLLNLRLARPSVLVDLRAIPDLDGIEVGPSIRVGARVTQAQVLGHKAACTAQPLLSQAIACIGHVAIRNQGTVVGSVAHADPAAELPAVAIATDATVAIASAASVRRVPARALFESHFMTVLQPDEIILDVDMPVLPPGAGAAWVEFAQRHGDFALVGVAAIVEFDDGEIQRVDVALSGVSSVPVLVDGVEAAGAGPRGRREKAVAEYVAQSIEPGDDLFASASYRRDLTRVLVEDAVGKAIYMARARDDNGH